MRAKGGRARAGAGGSAQRGKAATLQGCHLQRHAAVWGTCSAHPPGRPKQGPRECQEPHSIRCRVALLGRHLTALGGLADE